MQGLPSSQSTTEVREGTTDTRVMAKHMRSAAKSSQRAAQVIPPLVVETSKPGSVPETGTQFEASSHTPHSAAATTTSSRSDSFITLEEFAALTQRLHEAESQLQAAQRTSVTVTSGTCTVGEGTISTPPAKVFVKHTGGGISTLLPSSIVQTQVKTEIKTEPTEAIVINSDSDSEHVQRPSKPSTPGPLNVNVNVNLNFQDVPGLELLVSRGRASSTSSTSQQGDCKLSATVISGGSRISL